MASHSTILAWEIPQTGKSQSYLSPLMCLLSVPDLSVLKVCLTYISSSHAERAASTDVCWMNEFLSSEVDIPLPEKPFSNVAFITSFPVFKTSEASLHPEPTFIFHGSLRSGFNADFQALSPAHCFPRPAPYCARCPATHGLLEASAGQELSFSHLFPLTDLRCASAWSLLLLGSLSINFQPVTDATQR